MTINFVGQGYNQEKISSVAAELIRNLGNDSFNEFTCLVAFASKAGVAGLTKHINASKTHIRKFNIVIGIDQQATSEEALVEIVSWNVDAYVYHTTQRIIFHPKIYLFEGTRNFCLILGSNNLTQTGLAQNIEASLLIEFTIDDAEGMELLKQIHDYYEPILNGSDSNLQKLNEQLIGILVTSGTVPTEEKRRELYAKLDDQILANSEQNIEVKNNHEFNALFKSIPLQGLPIEFRISRPATTQDQSGIPETIATVAPNLLPTQTASVSPQVARFDLGNGWIVYNNEVLVVELTGPTRLSQANFDKYNFTQFFGAVPKTSNYYINLMYVDNNASIGSPIRSQAVTVQSSNYRFELDALKGKSFVQNTRPICTFIKVSADQFIYTLALPTDGYYTEVRTFLDNQWQGFANRVKRVRTTIQTLEALCPSLPFWSL